jgi:pimeloyl-ACP methyl ester carboxylesterase
VLLAPAYGRTASAAPPATLPPDGVPMNTQSRDEFYANWDRQVGCPDQYDAMAGDAVWSAMLASDPVGATWGPGVRRAPATAAGRTPRWRRAEMPTLLFAGAHDKQVPPDRVRELYADLGATQKVFVDLACSSHNAIWERNRRLMFKASLDWLTTAAVNGAKDGMVRIGY